MKKETRETKEWEKTTEIAGVMLLIGCIIGPLGLGAIFGAEIGWLALAFLLIVGGVRLAYVAKEERRETEKEEKWKDGSQG